jgi:hypothetical protein
MSNARFSLDQVNTDDEDVIPVAALQTRPAPTPIAVTPPAAPQPKPEPKVREGKSQAQTTIAPVSHDEPAGGMLLYTNVEHDSTRVSALAEERFAPAVQRQKVSQSIPAHLNRLIDAKVYELKMKGHKRMTRDAIFEDALMRYFGIKPV